MLLGTLLECTRYGNVTAWVKVVMFQFHAIIQDNACKIVPNLTRLCSFLTYGTHKIISSTAAGHMTA